VIGRNTTSGVSLFHFVCGPEERPENDRQPSEGQDEALESTIRWEVLKPHANLAAGIVDVLEIGVLFGHELSRLCERDNPEQ
jgi:hypothetical protein